jgi:hypothetical protein
MLTKKTLLAAAAVITLAVPAAAMAQDFGGYRDGGYHDAGRFEHHRYFGWRQMEREREMRRDYWRDRYEHRHYWRPDYGFYRDHDRWDEGRPY